VPITPPSDGRDEAVMKNAELFERAQRVIPGGVNSPVRAFRSSEVPPPWPGNGVWTSSRRSTTCRRHVHPRSRIRGREAGRGGALVAAFGAPTSAVQLARLRLVCH
jgi:hypothetical protein